MNDVIKQILENELTVLEDTRIQQLRDIDHLNFRLDRHTVALKEVNNRITAIKAELAK